MSRKKQTEYKRKAYESTGKKYIDHNGTMRTDTFATIYESMICSAAWRKLTPKQQVLYVICKAQIMGKRKPLQDFSEVGLFQEQECFYLSIDMICSEYQMYKRDSKGKCCKFYKDMKALEQNGFIEKVASGQNTRSKSVYKLSSKWQS